MCTGVRENDLRFSNCFCIVFVDLDERGLRACFD